VKKSWLINLTIVCIILGLLLSWQYNSFRASETDSPMSIFQQDSLDRINIREANIQKIEEEIGDLRNRLSLFLEYEAIYAGGHLEFLQDSLNFQRALASMTPVSGPGIIITLNDNLQDASIARLDLATYRAEDFIIHDWNMRYIVNELRAAGATAISINNQRLTAHSEIRCIGTVILINHMHMIPPFEITALASGNPEELKNRIESRGEIPALRANNFPVEIEVSEVKIPEYIGLFRSNYLELGVVISE